MRVSARSLRSCHLSRNAETYIEQALCLYCCASLGRRSIFWCSVSSDPSCTFQTSNSKNSTSDVAVALQVTLFILYKLLTMATVTAATIGEITTHWTLDISRQAFNEAAKASRQFSYMFQGHLSCSRHCCEARSYHAAIKPGMGFSWDCHYLIGVMMLLIRLLLQAFLVSERIVRLKRRSKGQLNFLLF